ncbi:hypothetical protein SAMN02745784_01832 [Tissierella praeacuta DSM 18095]|uniref:IrrE N-terminal-like domain-containing protein n=1 Tax=Tissierella praeacuta DSM 18095 TaxID=1123404 RepID=A0A1M4WF08_9FIRM|nr:hypothetical protein [Tissierella praeacuta]SHE79881.1 hypothetical protein SAMN02745784_01832 [Tissierella praeacuta DSM 18095]SUO99484.1 Uncharacterised protein [Tissierella praeacuta]
MNIDILDKSLLKSLLDETISFHEIMNAYNVRTSIAFNIPASILGFVYVSRRGNYHLILNGNVNYKTQCRTFVHEIKHITYDLPKIGYIVGLDMQHTYFENEADMLAEKIITYL